MTGFFSDKKRTLSAVLTVIFAITFCAVAACIIAAAPRDNDFEPQITVSSDSEKIIAPDTTESSSLPDSDATTSKDDEQLSSSAVTTHTDNIKVDAPETAAKETTATTEPIVTSEPETTEDALTEPETTEEDILTFDTSFEEIEDLTPPDGPFYVIPEMKDGLLADELSVEHTIKTPTFDITEEELILAATVIQLEVMGDGSRLYCFEDIPQKYWEMCAVAQCIKNRVESGCFPNTVKDVITQSTTYPNGYVIYQFSPAEKLAAYTPTEEAIVAAYEVLCNGVSVLPSNYYYFCATYICEYFEKGNAYMFSYNADGSVIKTEGHLTTFYAGRK